MKKEIYNLMNFLVFLNFDKNIDEFNKNLSEVQNIQKSQIIDILERVSENLNQINSKKIGIFSLLSKKFQQIQVDFLENEEIKLLRQEAQKIDSAWELQQNNWEKEKVELENTIHVLSEKDLVLQKVYCDLSKSLQEKSGIYELEIKSLQNMQKIIKSEREMYGKSMNGMKVWIENQESIENKEYKNELIERFSKIIENIQNIGQNQESPNENLQEKIQEFIEHEKKLNQIIEDQKIQISEYEDQISHSAEIFDKNIEKAKISIEAKLRETFSLENKRNLVEIIKLKEELANLKKKQTEKETKLVMEFGENLKALYKLLDDKNDIINELKMKNNKEKSEKSLETKRNDYEELLKIISQIQNLDLKRENDFKNNSNIIQEIYEKFKETLENIQLFTDAIKNESEGIFSQN